MCLSSVLFPEPLPPMTMKTSPRPTLKVTSRRMTRSPKAIVSPSTAMCGSGPAGARSQTISLISPAR